MPRCPNGTRKNIKTGNCEPTGAKKSPSPSPLPTPPHPKSNTKKCPKGTRKNKKTGECESTKAKIDLITKDVSKGTKGVKEMILEEPGPVAIEESPEEVKDNRAQELKHGWPKPDFSKLNGIELEYYTFEPDFGRLRDIGSNVVYHNMNLADSKLKYIHFRRVTLQESTFDNAKLENVTFHKPTTLNGVSFKNADLYKCKFYEGRHRSINFDNAKLRGCIFDGLEISSSHLLSFKNAKLEDVEFINISKYSADQLKEALKSCKSKKGISIKIDKTKR